MAGDGDEERAPVTPGEMLKEEFLAEYGLSQNQLAKAIGISPNRITRLSTIVDALRQILHLGSAFTLVIALSSG